MLENSSTSPAWDESRWLAEERGAFPEYDNSALKARGVFRVRNSCVTSIAPTGTISRLAGCSSGIEPHFALAWRSNVLWTDQDGEHSTLTDAPAPLIEALANAEPELSAVGAVLERLADDPDGAAALLGSLGVDAALYRTSMGIAPMAHVRMLAAWQANISNSVSKTINMAKHATVEEIDEVYHEAWRAQCKSVTIYRDGSKSMQVLETGATKQDATAAETAMVPRERPVSMSGVTDRVRTGHGNLYVTVSFDDDGKPFELFTNLGKAGGCDSANLEAVSRLASMSLRAGIEPGEILGHLQGISCCPAWDSGTQILSAPDAVAHVLRTHMANGDIAGPRTSGVQPYLLTTPESPTSHNGSSARDGCPKCSGELVYQEGCMNCMRCGYSKCD